jgi:hypothetical protein
MYPVLEQAGTVPFQFLENVLFWFGVLRTAASARRPNRPAAALVDYDRLPFKAHSHLSLQYNAVIYRFIGMVGMFN